MDKNSLTGVILIVLIVIGYNYLFPPVVDVENTDKPNTTVIVDEQNEITEQNQTATLTDTSELEEINFKNFGVFATSAQGSEEDIIIENDLLTLNISSKGGRVVSAILKDYLTSDSLPLNLLDRDSSSFNITFFSEGNRIINTQDLYFQSTNKTENSVAMRMMASNGGYLGMFTALKKEIT